MKGALSAQVLVCVVSTPFQKIAPMSLEAKAQNSILETLYVTMRTAKIFWFIVKLWRDKLDCSGLSQSNLGNEKH